VRKVLGMEKKRRKGGEKKISFLINFSLFLFWKGNKKTRKQENKIKMI